VGWSGVGWGGVEWGEMEGAAANNLEGVLVLELQPEELGGVRVVWHWP
jgi:hypothetical protein